MSVGFDEILKIKWSTDFISLMQKFEDYTNVLSDDGIVIENWDLSWLRCKVSFNYTDNGLYEIRIVPIYELISDPDFFSVAKQYILNLLNQKFGSYHRMKKRKAAESYFWHGTDSIIIFSSVYFCHIPVSLVINIQKCIIMEKDKDNSSLLDD